VRWRHSVDGCDSAGTGRVFVEVEDDGMVPFIENEFNDDENIIEFEKV
jgi:hypothetical protein